MPALHSVIAKDVDFLTRNNLIDYSFLVGELKPTIEQIKSVCAQNPAFGRGIYIDDQARAWLVGFIDPLNEYDYTKMAEYYAKKPMHGTDMSCVPPELYAPRFKDFMSSILVEDPQRFDTTNHSPIVVKTVYPTKESKLGNYPELPVGDQL